MQEIQIVLLLLVKLVTQCLVLLGLSTLLEVILVTTDLPSLSFLATEKIFWSRAVLGLRAGLGVRAGLWFKASKIPIFSVKE